MLNAVTASDGLRARESGPWGLTKLSFLDDFCPAAIQATERKLQRYYVDLFAGPGVNEIKRGGGAEYEGSPLRVLRYAGLQRADLSFTHAVFVNERRSDHEALEARVDRVCERGESRIPRDNVRLVCGDANVVIKGILNRIPREAYVLVFADMEAPKQWPWESMRALRAQGHRSVDLYTLFPLDMAVVRLLAYSKEHLERQADALTRFYGTDAWRDVASRRVTEARSPQLQRDLLRLYLRQLETLWQHAGEMVDVRLRGEQRLYKMLFASDHPAANRIAQWIRKHSTRDQGDLFA